MALRLWPAWRLRFELRRQLIQDRAVDIVGAVAFNFIYTVTRVTPWFLDRSKCRTEGDDKVLFIDARKILGEIGRAHGESTPAQIEFLANIAPLYGGEAAESSQGSSEMLSELFPDGIYCNAPGLCGVASLSEVERRGRILNPGRYVHLAAVNDGVDSAPRWRSCPEKLGQLNRDAASLQARVEAANLVELRG